MNYKTHVIGGFSAGVFANEYLLPHTNALYHLSPILMGSIFVAGSVMGSKVPDIDHRGSHTGRNHQVASFAVNTMFGHRGITHSPIFVMGMMALLMFLSKMFLSGIFQALGNYFAIGFGIGIASHLLLDALTVGGIPLLYPFSKKKFHMLPLRTGGFLEKVFAVLLVLATASEIATKYVSH
ncbi:metal-dependent hydrolase (plasmid) [Aneurinibacillus sp. Ricciae_BoGa-3]|uniref:metal-dependent hydrolase n=1 Tax=Aneurinibacillus sp. Ricciae_BoGa-3 TaxID=3022697 RepID=UPI0023417546|nr:metal-dependent hydrolase [Aneurinibacillus sp. Ricciae_BoGa-3]WCK57721.1 metal-dependent hydrolase [Aneurinibacillus sp. Ricciae_BoGa-3]